MHLDVPDEVLDARVPNLILQPLVENAIKHGVTARAEGGEVRVSVARDAAVLRLTVRDDGPGLSATAKASNGSGVGLANTRERLRQLYGDGARFSVSNHATGGVEVEISIPYSAADQRL